MTDVFRDIKSPDNFRSKAIGLFVAQLDDQNRRLLEDTHDITPKELEWQSAPGMNTIGMLLAHIAIVEVFWIQLGPMKAPNTRTADAAVAEILGIGADDDGMPLAANGLPPQVLAGRDLSFYEELLRKARSHTRECTLPLADADLDRTSSIKRKNGSTATHTVRWVLYHVLEHEAAHYGQVGLIRHLYRDRTAEKKL
jgi:uncharacterized damage-inducible protein DinB